MKNRIIEIKPKDNISNELGIESFDVEEIKIIKYKYKEIKVFLKIKKINILKDLLKLKRIMLNYIPEYADISFSYKIDIENMSIEDKISLYLELLNVDDDRIGVYFKNKVIKVKNNKINISVIKKEYIDDISKYSILDNLSKLILKYENIKYEITCSLLSENELVFENEKIEETEETEEIEEIKIEEEKVAESTKKLLGKIVEKINILDEENDNEVVVLEVDVFNIDLRELNSGNVLAKIYVTDYSESIVCTKFYQTLEKVDIKKGDRLKISGKYIYDTYTKSYVIQLYEYEKLETLPEREDNEEIKRVELNLHTNMSELCSNLKPEILMPFLKKMGYKAVGITDFGVLHALPFVDKYKGDIKAIMGIEAYVVDDEIELIVNPKNEHILTEEYTVFDIETTGLDTLHDKITEIGAIKIKNNQVIGEFSVFVNPEMIIPQEISELTHITQDMVDNAETIDKVLPKFMEFIGDSTLVAHNAKFDVGFIFQQARNLGIEYSKVSYIDTLTLSKFLLTDIKRFGLNYLCKYFDIELDNHHRAIYDAKATYQVFLKLLSMCYSQGVETLKELNEKIVPNIKNSNTINVNILAKNKEGIKWLNEMVSISHLEYYNRKPRIPKSLLSKKRENILISSSPSFTLENMGELINLYARGMEEEDIKKAMSFYDYIQIAPVETYNSAIQNGEFKDYNYIREMNKYLYNLATELNKPVVAVGNTYYLEEKDFIVKSILEKESNKFFKTYFIDNKNYFRTTKEMLDEFSYLGENISYEVVVKNTNDIANSIENFDCIPKGFYPPKIEGAEEQVKEMSYKRAYEIYGNPLPEIIEKKIERELNAIINNGFAVLYLTAQKLVKKSLENGYIVGSRGSVGSSLVAFLMGITEVNGLYPHYICPKCKNFEMMDFEGSGVDLPDKKCPKCGENYQKDGHAIPFEVFMGYEGDKVPDIDLNFSSEYQSNIHKYTEELFGSENVFRAGTISTLAQNMAYACTKKYYVDAKEKRGIDIKISEAEISRQAMLCEGARKTTGQHPGGMVVVPRDMSIYDFCPIQRPANDITKDPITHFDYHVMDQQLVKLDILGHDDPTTVKQLCESTGIDVNDIPIRDNKVIGLFSSPKNLGVKRSDLKVLPGNLETITGTNGIPEFGTAFVKRMLLKTKPQSFSELVRISGLSHGTNVWTNNAEDYVDKGVATLSEIISVRDDIMNYLNDKGVKNSTSFEIMEFVRKGQPSKNKEKWKEYKQIMKEHNIKEWYIESCEKIKYMFPKGHAVAYVTMAVRIAYFKVYYPLHFYMAYLNRKVSDFNFLEMHRPVEELKNQLKNILDNKNTLPKTVTDKIPILEILIEMHYRGIELLPIDLYKSDGKTFKIENDKIRIPFITMPNLGVAVADKIISERDEREFLSLDDLRKRTKISVKVLDILNKKNCLGNMSELNQQTLF